MCLQVQEPNNGWVSTLVVATSVPQRGYHWTLCLEKKIMRYRTQSMYDTPLDPLISTINEQKWSGKGGCYPPSKTDVNSLIQLRKQTKGGG